MSEAGPACWLIRTGESGHMLAECVLAGVVALRYNTVGDATDLNQAEIAEAIREAGTTVDLMFVAGMLMAFVHEVAVGDIIVTPHLGARSVYFATVTGPYFFADPSPVPGYRHLREVDWFGVLDRDADIPLSRRSEIDRPPTLYRLPDQSWWREQARHAQASTSEVRPPQRSKGRTASTSKTSAQPTAAFTVCSICGMQKPAGIVVHGICRDCD